MRTATDNLALLKTISEPRLRSYMLEAESDLDRALTLYERNTMLAESFYTPLQSLEICLRNALDGCMADRYGGDWCRNGNAPLADGARAMIADALRQAGQLHPLSPSELVAELKFAFWVSLLAPRYDGTLWRNALYRAFVSRPTKRRSDIHGRMNAIRRFRNRVAHHEPIFKRDLLLIHAEIIEAIGWMCPHTRSWTAHHSRVLGLIGPAESR